MPAEPLDRNRSRSTVTDRDAVTVDTLAELAAELADALAQTAAFCLLLASQSVAQNDPVTVALLGIGQFPVSPVCSNTPSSNTPSASAPDSPSPPQPTDLEAFDTRTDWLLSLVRVSKRPLLELVRLTFGADKPATLDAALAELRAELPHGGDFVRELSLGSGAEHLHGVLFAPSVEAATRLADALCSRHGLHPASVLVEPVRGYRGSARGLRRSLHFIGQYDFAVGKHAGKRARELPIGVESWGVLSSAEELARPLLASRPELCPPTVTAKLCACGCGHPPKAGLRYVDQKHSARARQARSRSNKRTKLDTVTPAEPSPVTVPDLCPETVTPEPTATEPRHGRRDIPRERDAVPEFGEPVTVQELCPPTVTAPTPASVAQPIKTEPSADPVMMAAQQAVREMGVGAHPHDLERRAVQVLTAELFELAPAPKAVERAVRKALEAAWGITVAAE